VSPTTHAPRLKLPGSLTSPVDDLGSETDPDEQSLTSELSDLSDDPDFQRRVEERGQKRVILRELTTREENGDELNEEEQALLSELRRAQEIETAAWSGGAGGLFEVEKIETTHWERYKEALRAEAMAAEDEHLAGDYKGGLYGEDVQDGADPLNGEGTESESEMERRSPYGAPGLPLLQSRSVLNAGGPSLAKLKHRDSLNLRQRSTSVTADTYSQPSRSHSVSSSAPKSRPVSSASQYPVAFSNTSSMIDRQDGGSKTDRVFERGRLSIKNEEEEEAHYQWEGAGPSSARPASRNGVASGVAGPSLAGGTGVGGTLAAGLVAKARDRRLGKPGGSAEYPASEFDDKREREGASRLQRDISLKEREARRAKPVTAAVAGGSGVSPVGVSNPTLPVRTPRTRKQNQPDATTAGRGISPATVESIAVAERGQPTSSMGKTLRGTGTKRARSPSTGPREGMVEKVPATKYGGSLPPSNPRNQRRSRRDQQQHTLSQHGAYTHDSAQQQHQAHLQYQQPAYSQPIYPTAGPNVPPLSQYAPNGTLLSRSVTAPGPVAMHGHAQGLLPQVAHLGHPNTSGNSSTTSSTREGSSTSIVVRHPIYHVDKYWA